MRVWGKIKVEDRIQDDVTLECGDFESGLLKVCEHFDLTKPIIVGKHQNEINRFFRTIFYPDDFIESVNFDTLEIEILVEKKKS